MLALPKQGGEPVRMYIKKIILTNFRGASELIDASLMPDELRDFVRGYLQIDSDGKYSPFWTNINQRFNA